MILFGWLQADSIQQYWLIPSVRSPDTESTLIMKPHHLMRFRTAFSAGLLILCLTGVGVFMVCKQSKSPAPDRKIFVGVFERQLNPIDYHDYLMATWSDYVAYVGTEFSVFKDNPANVSQNLAQTNIDWGNYAEAAFYAKRAVEIKRDKDTIRVYALATLLAGGAGATALLQEHDPILMRDLSTIRSYADLIVYNGDVAEKRRLLRNMLSATGYLAKDFLILFLQQEKYSPKVEELDMVAEEVVAYFDGIGIRIQKDGENETILKYLSGSELYQSDSYYLGLGGLYLSDLYYHQANLRFAAGWDKRAKLAIEFAAKSINYGPSMRHRFDQVEVSLKATHPSVAPTSQ